MDTEKALAVDKKPERLSTDQKHERKKRVLKYGATALVRSIASAIVIKSQDLFFLAEPDGRVPLGDHHGFGLYYHDCRFLNGYEMRIAQARPDVLASTASQGVTAYFELTNPDIRMENGQLIHKEQIGIKWIRRLDGETRALVDTITIQNLSLDDIAFPLALTFRTAFEDIFEVRGAEPEKRGRFDPPAWKHNQLSFVYAGADQLYRSLTVHMQPAPAATYETTAEFHIRLSPREHKEITVTLGVSESPDLETMQPKKHSASVIKKIKANAEKEDVAWAANRTVMQTDSWIVNQVLDRSLRDLAILRSNINEQEFFAAGLPWFGTLFGRDSLITALQTLAYDPAIAEQTLRVLSHYQGKQVNEWRDEEPGKILHELRVGEMAHLEEIPQTPYYGSVDSTPLFLVLVAQHAAWTGSLDLFNALRGNVERALEWVDRYGDRNGDGYVEYETRSSSGLSNQGWKDSVDSVSNDDGSLAKPPIALVEVQGYVYMAKQGLADLYERAGEPGTAAHLRQEADALRHRFNADYWGKEKEYFALALQKGGRPAAIVTSNPGQALWTGIVDPERAGPTVVRMMADDMFSGWGIRTLSERERRYSPIGYHLGTVWPHDNSLIGAGFRRYGFDDEFRKLFTSMLEAAIGFRFYRLPELFAGFRREEFGVPVRYPVACHPQAWAAGTMPLFVTNMLGLVPEAFENRLRIVRPLMLDMLNRVEVHQLKVGTAQVDLRFDRTPDGVIAVNVQKVNGTLDVVIEPTTSQTPIAAKGTF